MKLVWIVLLSVIGVATGCNDAIEATSSPNDATSNEQPIISPKPARTNDSLIALYEFNLGALNNTVYDTSGYGVAQNIFIRDMTAVTWLSRGLRIDSPVEIVTGDGATNSIIRPTQIETAVKATDNLTWEAWIKPANITQTGQATIFSYSYYTSTKNIMVGQDGGEYTVHFTTDSAGIDMTTQSNAATVSLTHLAVTWSSVSNELRLYVNGSLVITTPCSGSANGSWQDLPIRVGHEIDDFSPAKVKTWLGEIYLIAMYDRVLTDAEILNNYYAGTP